MEDHSKEIIHNDLMLYYERYGMGDKVFVAFTGYGMRCNSFEFITQHSNLKKTSYFIIGLFHIESEFLNRRTIDTSLSSKEFYDLFELFLQKEKISKFSLVGYSIGARLCMQLISTYYNDIENILFIAPDGIIQNRWYKYIMLNNVTRKLFKMTGERSDLVLRIVKFLNSLGFVSRAETAVVMKNIQSGKLKIVYAVWMAYHNIMPNFKSVSAVILKENIPVSFVFAKDDALIPSTISNKISNSLVDYANIEIIDDNHQLLKEKNVEIFLKALKRNV